MEKPAEEENGKSSKNRALAEKLIPLSLTAGLLLLDQLTKYLVVTFIPPYSVGASFFGDFFRIIHVYNPGIAFSIGNGLSGGLRGILFAVLPLAVLGMVLVVYFRSNELTRFQRWAVAGIVGGGLGNLVDRFFRPEGVVDFLDFKFYGIFGFERWPTFNIADMSVLICGALLVISFIVNARDEVSSSAGKEDQHD